ncbi:hypothetical protein V8F20_007126 [Naviculisporaceae sp. PSN 640]
MGTKTPFSCSGPNLYDGLRMQLQMDSDVSRWKTSGRTARSNLTAGPMVHELEFPDRERSPASAPPQTDANPRLFKAAKLSAQPIQSTEVSLPEKKSLTDSALEQPTVKAEGSAHVCPGNGEPAGRRRLWRRPLGISAWAAYTRFPVKKDGGLRVTMDYRPVNGVSIKPQWPVHSQPGLFRCIATGDHKIFFQGYAAHGYLAVKMAPGHEQYAAFIAPNAQYTFENGLPWITPEMILAGLRATKGAIPDTWARYDIWESHLKCLLDEPSTWPDFRKGVAFDDDD